jgi:glycosyltransferase involved in cell wall biosynthesis
MDTTKTKKISVVIPCYNEEQGVGAVIKNFPQEQIRQRGYELSILVIDNNSTDNTTAVARALGAKVIYEPKKGKGNAIRTGFYNIDQDTDFVVMLDGDDTYKAHEILRLVEPIDSGFSDVIIGSRLGGKIRKGGMRGFNRLGNWGFSFLVRTIYRVNVTDTLTGYFAWRADVVRELRKHVVSSGFAIEMEMITKMARLNYSMYSVPITYAPRLGESSLRPIHDGIRILREFLRQLTWQPKIERIAFVSDTIYPFNKGGKEKRLHEIATRLVKKGREVHIYTMKWWNGDNTIMQNGMYLHGITKRRPLYTHNGRRSISEAIWFSVACLKLIKEPFDVMDVDSMPFFPLFTTRIVCTLRGKKMYGTWHEVWGNDYWSSYLGYIGGKCGACIEWLAMRMPHVIVSNSEHTTRDIRRTGIRKEIVTVPLGVDIDDIMTTPTHTFTSDIIYAGRLIDHKNVDKLVKAVAILKKSNPTIRCVIVGNGPERELLENMVHADGLEKNITFFNFLEDHRELYGLMKASKILVLPSTREGFGIIVVEANACGLPVITTAHEHNAARDLIIEGENGFLSDTNPEHLAQYIEKALHSDTMKPRDVLEKKFGTYRWDCASTTVEKLLTSSV